jgi:ferredoxin--NADP+ reductase
MSAKTSQQNIAIVGAGPAALYAAQRLSKEGHAIALFNRDIKHGGLAEYGIYPNKYKMKSGLRKMFRRILDDENVSYFGHVRVGEDEQSDITIQDLRDTGFDAIVVAVGAQGTKWLGLPGEGLEGVYHAKDLVYHYNGLPPFSERDFPIGDDVCVIGLGNVCMDIVHWLVCDVQCKSVTAVARRGPAERAYTNKEMKLVSGALDAEAVRADIGSLADALGAVGQDADELADQIVRFKDTPLEVESNTRFAMRFLRSPVEIVGSDGQTDGLRCEITTLGLRDDGVTTRALGSGEFETIPCDTVVFAIGDSIEPSIGLPLEPRWGSTFMTVPEPWSESPDAARYMVYDPETQTPIWDTFVVGWARKASDGLVGKARSDAVTGCDEILAYLDGKFEVAPSPPTPPVEVRTAAEQLLRDRDVEFVTWDGVLRLMEQEEQVAAEGGLPEYKYTTTSEMLTIVRKADS